jgi:predicted phage terminase large subunit-like protein
VTARLRPRILSLGPFVSKVSDCADLVRNSWDLILNHFRSGKPREWAEEQGQIKSGVGPFIERMLRERQAFVYRRTFPTRGDKAVRAQSIRGRMALHGLYVPQNASWVAELRSELLSFPAGKHDDQVDGLGLIGQLLDTILRATSPSGRAAQAQQRIPPI